MTRSSRNAGSLTLLLAVLLSSFGCSSVPPSPRSSVPRPSEVLSVDPDSWDLPKTEDGPVLLPFEDLHQIMTNRQRWINYAKSLEPPGTKDPFKGKYKKVEAQPGKPLERPKGLSPPEGESY